MKKIFTIAFLLGFINIYAQSKITLESNQPQSFQLLSSIATNNIVQVGTGEYSIVWRTTNGHVYGIDWTGGIPVVFDYGLTNLIDVDGAQYTSIALDGSGNVYTLGTSATYIAHDTTGADFTGNTQVYGWFKFYASLRGGAIWLWGTEDNNFLGLGDRTAQPINKPFQLTQPSGKTFTKLVFCRWSTPAILALASDGTVWKYEGSTTATQVTFTGTAKDIAAIGSGVFVIITNTDGVLAFGSYASYVGLSNGTTTPTSIKSAWISAGVQFPLKQVIGNYNTLHVIDALNDHYASGSNVCGEIGNGVEYNPYRTRGTSPWNWNLNSGELVTSIVRVPGKFININTGTTYAFYVWAQDWMGNWYSWGRNKRMSLGNGLTLDIVPYGNWGNALDIPAPKRVDPLNTSWTVLTFNPSGVPAPVASAGVDQYITTNSTTLYGNASSQQEGTITTYAWSQIGGPTCTITHPADSITTVTGLVNAIYTFRLTVTNNYSVSSYADVIVSYQTVLGLTVPIFGMQDDNLVWQSVDEESSEIAYYLIEGCTDDQTQQFETIAQVQPKGSSYYSLAL